MKIKLAILTIGVICILESCQDKVATLQSPQTEVNHNLNPNPGNEAKHSTATLTAESVNDPLALKLKKYLAEEYLTEADNRAIEDKDRLFQLYEIDLNNDGKKEIFVNFISPYFCGTGGCTMLLLNSDLKLITTFTVTQTPLYAEKDLVNGYKKLLVKSEGDWKELTFDGKKYPSNPTLLKKSTIESPGSDAEVIFDEKYLKAKTYTF